MPENGHTEQSLEVRSVKLSEIRLDDTNVRQSDRNKDVDLLAESIREHGMLQPVVLMGEWGNPPYHLVVGQRRFLAHRRLDRTHILARFVAAQSKEDARVLSLIENLQRVEVNYADIAAAVTRLWGTCRDDRKVATTLNLKLRTVRDYLRMELFATPGMKQAVGKNPKLKPVAKRALLAAQNNPQKAEKLFFAVKEMAPDSQRRMVDYGSSHPEASAEALISEARKPKVQESVILVLDDGLRGALSTAQKALAMDWGDIVSRALREWLADKGFLRRSP